MTVTLDGVTLTLNAEGKCTLPTLASGMKYVKTTTTLNSDGTTSEAYAVMTLGSDNVYTAIAGDKDSLDGVIRLKTAFEMKYSSAASDDFDIYAKYDGKELKDGDKFTTTAGYIPVGKDGTATVWVAAAKENTEIVVAEGKESDVSEMTLVQEPKLYQKGLWEVSVNTAVTEATFAAGLQLPAGDASPKETADGTASAAVAIGTKIEFKVAGLELDGAEATSVVWEDGTTHENLAENVTVNIGADGSLVITATAEKEIAATAENLGAVRVTIKTASGLTMEGVYVLKLTISTGSSGGGGGR